MYTLKLTWSIILLFLLETKAFVESVNVSNSISHLTQTEIQPLQKPHEEEKLTHIIIPVFAKKAGGHLKHELLNPINSTPSSQVNELSKEDERNVEDSQQEEKVEKVNSNETPEGRDSKFKMESTHQDYGYDETEEDEEPECPDEQFWHIRGLRCVPVQCPGGNQWRDVNTGECILRYYGKHGGRKRWNRYRRIYWSLGNRGRARFTGES